MQKVLGNSERFVMTWTTFKSTEIMKYSLSIHEAHSEIPDYNRPWIHLSWAQNLLSKTKSLQLNSHEAFLCMWKIFLEDEHHDIPEFCLSTTSGNHTINHVCHTDRNILTQSGKMFAHLTWTKCHQITLAQLLLLSPHKSSQTLLTQSIYSRSRM